MLKIKFSLLFNVKMSTFFVNVLFYTSMYAFIYYPEEKFVIYNIKMYEAIRFVFICRM